MDMTTNCEPFLSSLRYLSEGGQETELMYGHGFDLPQFALFPMLDDPEAVMHLTRMYQAVLDVAERHRMGIVLGGLDYRASPDWAGLLGMDEASLARYQHRSIDFLRDVAAPYVQRVPHILISGIVGPRGDAYERNDEITEESAEAYHSTQMATLAAAKVDLVHAMTFNSIEEAIGVVRAGRKYQLPIVVSFVPDSATSVAGLPSLREVIERVDQATAGYALFYGINCSHPAEFETLIEERGAWLDRIGSLRPNASRKEKVELCQIGHLERGDPLDLAERMGRVALKLPNAVVWGGCCGTWDEHLDGIATAVLADSL